MHAIFKGFRQTFDQLHINQLMKDLENIRIEIRGMIKITMDQSNTVVIAGKILTKKKYNKKIS